MALGTGWDKESEEGGMVLVVSEVHGAQAKGANHDTS